MPNRTKATLRDLRTAEVHLQHLRERDRLFTRGMELTREVLSSNLPPHEMISQLRQLMTEGDMDLRVAQRHHELRLQELQTITKFPDEE